MEAEMESQKDEHHQPTLHMVAVGRLLGAGQAARMCTGCDHATGNELHMMFECSAKKKHVMPVFYAKHRHYA